MSEPTPDPVAFDPSEFTAAELTQARQFLLSLRHSQREAKPVEVLSVSEGESVEWRKTEYGGQARRNRVRTTTSRHGSSVTIACDWLGPASDWYDCAVPPRRDPELPADPDHVIDPPCDDAR